MNSANCTLPDDVPGSVRSGFCQATISKRRALDSNFMVVLLPDPAGPFSTSSLCRTLPVSMSSRHLSTSCSFFLCIASSSSEIGPYLSVHGLSRSSLAGCCSCWLAARICGRAGLRNFPLEGGAAEDWVEIGTDCEGVEVGRCLTRSSSDRRIASARASSIESSSIMSSSISSLACSTSGVADRFRHLSSSETLLKKLCNDWLLISSVPNFCVFRAFCGDDLGDGRADAFRGLSGFESLLSPCFVDPFLIEFGLRALSSDKWSGRLKGRAVVGPACSSSSESTTVDLRWRFAGRGSEDMAGPLNSWYGAAVTNTGHRRKRTESFPKAREEW